MSGRVSELRDPERRRAAHPLPPLRKDEGYLPIAAAILLVLQIAKGS